MPRPAQLIRRRARSRSSPASSTGTSSCSREGRHHGAQRQQIVVAHVEHARLREMIEQPV
jgi:hypothetical protein